MHGSEPEAHGERWLIAGLGNPGAQYGRSRHNTGFAAATHLADAHHIDLNRRKFNGLYGEGAIDGERALLVLPQTFYNRSGECIAAMLGYFKIPLARLIVLHDEIDLPLGQIRIKRGGGDAGNRGVRSVAGALGPDFIRVRLGVGHPQTADGAVEHVLQPFTDSEFRVVSTMLDRAVDAIHTLVRDGLERAMNLYNQRV